MGSSALRPTLLALCVAAVAVHGELHGDLPLPMAVQALSPMGIRFAVPDSRGTDLVIINANVNVPIDKKAIGKISGSASKTSTGLWTMEDPELHLKIGDVVFYWVYVSKRNRESYTSGRYIVRELANAACGITLTTVNDQPACQGQLIFEETFDTLDANRWKPAVQFSDDPDLDFCTYTSSPSNSAVQNGTLHIKATLLNEDEHYVPLKLENCTFPRGGRFCERNPIGWDIRPPTESAWLSTRGNFSFKYGRVDIRAKPAVGDWLLSKLWLEPRDGVYGPYPYDSGRVEMARVQGNSELVDPDGKRSGARSIYVRCAIATCYRVLYFGGVLECSGDKKWTDGMHVYSVTWKVGKITFEVDGERIYTVIPPEGGFLNHDSLSEDCTNSPWESGTTMAPFDQEFHINIGLVVGGFHIYTDGADSNGNVKPWTDRSIKSATQFWRTKSEWFHTWKSDFEVDYVKVWAI